VFVATLFDFNGVLVDDEAVHLAAFREVLAPLGVGFPDEAYWERYLGFDDVGAFRAMLVDAGRDAPDSLIRELVEQKKPRYMTRARQSLAPFAGATDLVRRRARTGPVGVVSGALRQEIELGLEVLGVTDAVAFVVSAEDTERGKPDPEGYLLGLGRLGPSAARERVLVVEDSVAGVRAAKAAGTRCIGVGHSTDPRALERAGADWTFANLAAVSDDVLEQLARELA
jgi:beta-phosphoglucomutase